MNAAAGTVVERLAAWAAAFRAQPLPPEVVHHARRAVIDLHAALISGAVQAPATLLEKALAEELDRGEARLALGRRATVRAAGLINGTAAHTTEVDDIFRDGIYHPGAPTIPAALALAQSPQLLYFLNVFPDVSVSLWVVYLWFFVCAATAIRVTYRTTTAQAFSAAFFPVLVSLVLVVLIILLGLLLFVMRGGQ